MNKSLVSLILTLFLFTSIVVFQGCKDDEDKPAPPLPPTSSIVMDFSDFPDADTTSARDIETYQNWWWAASNVVVWNTFITIGMAVPVASFVEAFNHEAIYDPDSDSWTWSYNFTAGGAVHLASLHASIVQDSVRWDMYITKQNVYSEFLWYYGMSDLLATGGYWIINKDPQDPIAMLQITWHRDTDLGAADIKYMNIIPGGAENGGYIFYGINSDAPYNAFYDIYNKGLDNLTNITWNRTTKDGQVKDPGHFGDASWHCWNDLLQDIMCE